MDESHVRKTYQAQDPAPAGHLENRLLPAGHRQRRAAAGKNGDHLLGGRDETFPSLIGIAERLAGTSDLVDPGLKGRRDREVMQRYAEHDDVGRQHFVGERVRQREHLPLGVCACGLGGLSRFNPRLAQIGNRAVGQIALDDVAIRVGGAVHGAANSPVNLRETELLRGLELVIGRVFIVGISSAAFPCYNMELCVGDGSGIQLLRARPVAGKPSFYWGRSRLRRKSGHTSG